MNHNGSRMNQEKSEKTIERIQEGWTWQNMRRKREQVHNGMQKKHNSIKTIWRKNWQLYLLVLPAVVYIFVFNYMPMYGVQIAFRDYKAVNGIFGSEWVGLKYFKTFFNAYYCKRLISNTLFLNVYGLLWGFPIPIILAILLNRIRSNRRKRFIQTTIYIPYFISTIVLAGMLYVFLSPSSGILTSIGSLFHLPAKDLMSNPNAFRSIYIISGVWQGAGYGTILYIAALSGIDPTLYEAAEMDGASIWQEIRYIDIPSIMPTIMISLILNCGGMLSSNTDKALALQTPGNIAKSDVIGVYVYNMGLGGGEFSYTAAIGLFATVINFVLIMTVNKVSTKVSNVGLF